MANRASTIRKLAALAAPLLLAACIHHSPLRGPLGTGVSAAAQTAARAADIPELLLVGGGYDREHNQVAIESDVRYLTGLFAGAPRTVLFASGSKTEHNVVYEVPADSESTDQWDLSLALTAEWPPDQPQRFRAPQLPQLDGPTTMASLRKQFSKLAHSPSRRPLVIYFVGHGAEGDRGDIGGNSFSMWDGDFTVRDLAAELSHLSTHRPITLVMAQCFSGGFASCVLKGAKNGAEVAPQELAGFFGATADREAAGCTPDIHEADYKDFTAFFMAALTGRDRFGHTVIGADYDGDGRVEMDEAYCYALITDPTIDVPVCTSDAFLRDRQVVPDEDAFAVPWSQVLLWARPAQKAALVRLAPLAPLAADQQSPDLIRLYRQLFDPSEPSPDSNVGSRFDAALHRFYIIQKPLRRALLSQWPALRHPASPAFSREREAALHSMATNPEISRLLAANTEVQAASDAADTDEALAARQLRLLRLAKSVVLAHRIHTAGTAQERRDLDRIQAAEHRVGFVG